jgi:hypothetical protein
MLSALPVNNAGIYPCEERGTLLPNAVRRFPRYAFVHYRQGTNNNPARIYPQKTVNYQEYVL